MSELYLFVALVLSLLSNGLLIYLSYKEKQKILDRAKAKDLEEFKHFEQDYPNEVKHKKETLEGQRKARKKRPVKPDPQDVKRNKYGNF